ncbi:MAG: hypothetical protein LIP03_05805 [Bacteroidales bacterium]|nr:hypothetical protein [Bacteroidales bacterium]
MKLFNAISLTLALALPASFIGMRAEAQSNKESYEDFLKRAFEEYQSFRDKANKEYADFLENPWQEFQEKEAPIKQKDPTPPELVPYDETEPEPEPQETPIEEVITPPTPQPQPKPVEPIPENPLVETYLTFEIWGTQMKVRWSDDLRYTLKGTDESKVANGWRTLSDSKYNNTIADLLKLRDQYKLDDWAYLTVLKTFSDKALGADTNESMLLTAFAYCSSGYQMRLGNNGNKLYLLYASNHQLFAPAYYYTINGVKYYPFSKDQVKSMNISESRYPGEKPMSLQLTAIPNITPKASSPRKLTAKRYPEMDFTLSTDENVVSYFDNYPTSMLDGNQMTRWVMYANTPLSSTSKSVLYPALKEKLSGMSQYDAVSRILNWVQTAFVYEFDDKVWGGDRAFFGEETLHYPYCDCEDRAILFSRLVKDIVGLDAVLVFYPGHLASAVAFTETVNGDCIVMNGRRFTICDPTYVNAPVGRTMPSMDNSSAKVILIN